MQDLNTASAITETQSETTIAINIKLDAASVFQSIQYEKEQGKGLFPLRTLAVVGYSLFPLFIFYFS